MRRYNPFKPNSPVFDRTFGGRSKEINIIDEALNQAKYGNPLHLLFIGKRGIGKTSLLYVAKQLARGALTFTAKHDFLPVHISINKQMTLLELAKKLDILISRELDKSEPAKAFMKKAWDIIQRLEVRGIKLRQDEQKLTSSEMIDYICFSIADTAKAITELTEQRVHRIKRYQRF